MASNQFGAGDRPYTGRSAADIQAEQKRAKAADSARAGAAAGRDRRSIGKGGGQ